MPKFALFTEGSAGGKHRLITEPGPGGPHKFFGGNLVDYSNFWVPASSDFHSVISTTEFRTSLGQTQHWYSDDTAYVVMRWYIPGAIAGNIYHIGYYIKSGPGQPNHHTFLEGQSDPSGAASPVDGFPGGTVVSDSSWALLEGTYTVPPGDISAEMLVQSYGAYGIFGGPNFDAYVADWFIIEV